METPLEKKAREETNNTRKLEAQWRDQSRQIVAREELSKPLRRKALPLFIVITIVMALVAWGLAGRSDAANGYGQKYQFNSNSAIFVDGVDVIGIPNFFVGAQWGYGVVCIKSAGFTAPASGPWFVSGEDYSKACIGQYAEARVSITFPNGGYPFTASYRITLNYLGGYNVGYVGPQSEPFHRCYIGAC